MNKFNEALAIVDALSGSLEAPFEAAKAISSNFNEGISVDSALALANPVGAAGKPILSWFQHIITLRLRVITCLFQLSLMNLLLSYSFLNINKIKSFSLYDCRLSVDL